MVKDFNPKLRDRIVTTAMIIEVRINLRRSSFTCSAIDIWVEVIGLSDLVMNSCQYNIIIVSLNTSHLTDITSYLFCKSISQKRTL